MIGTITRRDPHSLIITGEDGVEYFGYRDALQMYGSKAWDDVEILDWVKFTPISGASSGRWKNHPRAIEIVVRPPFRQR